MSEKKTYPHTASHREMGDWIPQWQQFHDLDPDFLQAYLAFRSIPQSSGSLETIQLTTVMGIHFCNLALPILIEEVEKSEASQ